MSLESLKAKKSHLELLFILEGIDLSLYYFIDDEGSYLVPNMLPDQDNN
jgi:hypothetical protein